MVKQKSKRIYLSPPHLDGRETALKAFLQASNIELLIQAYESNWIILLLATQRTWDLLRKIPNISNIINKG